MRAWIKGRIEGQLTYLTEEMLRRRVGKGDAIGNSALELTLLIESAVAALQDRFDIFLSHSIRDAKIVYGVKRLLEETGKTVYVDWIVDPQLHRNAVSAGTAETLRKRMRKCDACFYLYSQHSQTSRWMPWELGFFDGMNGNVAILPILPPSGTLDIEGEEYLEVYPKIDFANIDTVPAIYVNQAKRLEVAAYKRFDEWRAGSEKLRPLS